METTFLKYSVFSFAFYYVGKNPEKAHNQVSTKRQSN